MLIVRDYDSYVQALEFINGSELLAYDVETTGRNPRKDKIIGFGVSNGLDGFYVPLLAYELKEKALVAQTALVQRLHMGILAALAKRSLLMFNGSFDSRFTFYNFGVNLVPALHTDVLLLKHTCDEEFPFGLKEIATKLWGINVTEEKENLKASIKANGGKPTEYFKADYKILGTYCVQDCHLTFRLYNHYKGQLKRDGLHDFFYTQEVMPLYKQVTIPMEMRGVALDMQKLHNALAEITVDIASLEQQIQHSIAPYIADWTSTYLDKEYPLVTPKGNQTKLGRKMADNGFTDKFRMQAGAWRADNPGTPSIFNLNSKHHLKALFFDILKEEPLGRTPTGQPQVDDEFITSMATKYGWCKLLTDYNKLIKIKGTYIERFINEAEEGIFYPSFFQHRTVSGRYGSDIQQLPRPILGDSIVAKYNNQLREFIIARPGHKLVSADYEQLEPTIFAHVSGDAALQEIFQHGRDFYSEVAIRTERLQGVSSSKEAPNYLGKVSKESRQRAKAYALGIAYGMTGYKLQFELEIEQEIAERLVNDYLNAFPQLARWMNESKDKAKFDGFVRSQFGRVRHLSEAVAIFRKYGQRIFNSLQLWKDYNQTPDMHIKAKEDRKTIVNLCNNAINFQVQSAAASIVNRAGIALAAKVVAVAQIHDEWLFEVPVNELEATCKLIKEVMETNIKLSVPLRTEPQIGDNFRECK